MVGPGNFPTDQLGQAHSKELVKLAMTYLAVDKNCALVHTVWSNEGSCQSEIIRAYHARLWRRFVRIRSFRS